MATMHFTEADRDDRGFIRLSPRLRYQLTIAAAGVVGVLLVLASMRFSAPRAMPSADAPIPNSAPSAAAAPSQAPIPAAAPVAMLPAFASPDGTQLGMIESTRAITREAHYGNDWIQADVQGSGLVWLRAADWPSLAIIGPDLAPRPTAIPAPIVIAPRAPDLPPPAPTQCAVVNGGGKTASACGTDDLATLQQQAQAAWQQQVGGNIGIVRPMPTNVYQLATPTAIGATP